MPSHLALTAHTSLGKRINERGPSPCANAVTEIKTLTTNNNLNLEEIEYIKFLLFKMIN